MADVVKLFPVTDVPAGLRNIADAVEAGEFPDDGCTLIIGLDVFHLGCVDDGEAAANAIWDMTFGIQKLMTPVVDKSRA